MVEYTLLTDAELNEIIADAGVLGFIVGVFIGLVILVVFLYLLKDAYRKNFKMWVLQLPEKQKIIIFDKIKLVYDTVDEIANESNTRFFKIIHNDLCKLKSYLSQKWMQS